MSGSAPNRCHLLPSPQHYSKNGRQTHAAGLSDRQLPEPNMGHQPAGANNGGEVSERTRQVGGVQPTQNPMIEVQNNGSGTMSRFQTAQELAKLAERVQEEGRELDEELAEAKIRFDSITKIAEGEVKNATKRKNLASINEKIAELEESLKMSRDGSVDDQRMPAPETGRFGSQTPMTYSNGQQEKAWNQKDFLLEDDDSEDGKPFAKRLKPTGEISTRQAALAPATDQRKEDEMTEDQAPRILNHGHGVWTEKTARDILGHYLDYPLVQTTLNYFESYMSEKLLEELAETLRNTPAARTSFQILRQAWGGDKTDHFLRCANYSSKRWSPRTLSWNKYYKKGYPVHRHGGPRSMDQNMSLVKYRKSYYSPLFGCDEMDLIGIIDLAELTKLYRSFLQTEYAGSNPCHVHSLGVLGIRDKCVKCHATGSVKDLN